MPAGDYAVIRQLGKGSFGRVFLVKNVHDDSPWVMKEIDLAASGDPVKARADALKEVGMLSRLDHPNIVQYKECFQTSTLLTPPPPAPASASPAASSSPSSPTPVALTADSSSTMMYIIMEYADAGDLNHRIRSQRKPFTEQQVLNYFTQLALAIKHLHDRKCLHRDIKAENIFLTSDNRIKLGDFGISKLLPSTFACAITRIGTPYYLSPEICMNRPYNTASDMWSLGVCLYEMCMLAHPFDASSMEGLLKKIVRVPHRPIHNFYHPELRHLCDALMNKNATKRPSIGEVLRVPLVHREIGKWLTKRQIEQEFLFAGMNVGGGERGEGEVSPSVASTVSTGLLSVSPVSASGSEGEMSPRRPTATDREREREREREKREREAGAAVAAARPAAGEGAAAKAPSSSSRPSSSGGSKKRDDDTWQWLKAAEEKLKAQEDKRRQLADAKAAAPQPPPPPTTTKASQASPSAYPSSPPAPTSRPPPPPISARPRPSLDRGPLPPQRSSPEEKQPHSPPPPPPPATDLHPIPSSSIFSASPRPRPLPNLIPGSQPSSPTQSKRDLHSQLASQPPSPTHKGSSGAAFRVGVERRSGAVAVSGGHRRGASGLVIGDEGKKSPVKGADVKREPTVTAKAAGRV